MNYFKLTINKTAKPMGRAKSGEVNEWQRYDQEVKEFETVEEVKKYLDEQYFYAKTKYPTYYDGKDGRPVKGGFIYAFKSDPCSYGDCHHFEQHWVSIYKIKSEAVNL